LEQQSKDQKAIGRPPELALDTKLMIQLEDKWIKIRDQLTMN